MARSSRRDRKHDGWRFPSHHGDHVIMIMMITGARSPVTPSQKLSWLLLSAFLPHLAAPCHGSPGSGLGRACSARAGSGLLRPLTRSAQADSESDRCHGRGVPGHAHSGSGSCTGRRRTLVHDTFSLGPRHGARERGSEGEEGKLLSSLAGALTPSTPAPLRRVRRAGLQTWRVYFKWEVSSETEE
eukprot:2202904-Rhodomonas_salina.1